MKKIGISSDGKDLDSMVSPALGICPYLCIVEWDNGQIDNYKAIPNPAVSMGCTGIGAAQELVNEGIEALLIGNIGTGSFNYLDQQGIEVYQIQNLGKVEDAVQDYFNNKLQLLNNPNSPGRGQGSGRGGGQGGGQGMGRGRGQGKGGGQGRGGGGQGRGGGRRNKP
jgi:predicted Fe-Mo cluster-binding NifX family protein